MKFSSLKFGYKRKVSQPPPTAFAELCPWLLVAAGDCDAMLAMLNGPELTAVSAAKIRDLCVDVRGKLKAARADLSGRREGKVVTGNNFGNVTVPNASEAELAEFETQASAIEEKLKQLDAKSNSIVAAKRSPWLPGDQKLLSMRSEIVQAQAEVGAARRNENLLVGFLQSTGKPAVRIAAPVGVETIIVDRIDSLPKAEASMSSIRCLLLEVRGNVDRLEKVACLAGMAPEKAISSIASGRGDDADIYDRFKAAVPVEAAKMMADPKIAARLKAESARRMAAAASPKTLPMPFL